MLKRVLVSTIFALSLGWMNPVSAGIIVTEGDVTGQGESDEESERSSRSSEGDASNPALDADGDAGVTTESELDDGTDLASDDVPVEDLDIDLAAHGYTCRDLGAGVEYCEGDAKQKSGVQATTTATDSGASSEAGGCSGGGGSSAPLSWLVALSALWMCRARSIRVDAAS